jgi:hypothetical protein
VARATYLWEAFRQSRPPDDEEREVDGASLEALDAEMLRTELVRERERRRAAEAEVESWSARDAASQALLKTKGPGKRAGDKVVIEAAIRLIYRRQPLPDRAPWRRVPVGAVAANAGVSPPTATRVLDDYEGVLWERQRRQKAIRTRTGPQIRIEHFLLPLHEDELAAVQAAAELGPARNSLKEKLKRRQFRPTTRRRNGHPIRRRGDAGGLES